MNKETFIAIFNKLSEYGNTKLSKAGTSIVCYSHIPDTTAISSLLPTNWSINTNQPTWSAKENKMMPAMTVVFSQESQSADEAFAAFKG